MRELGVSQRCTVDVASAARYIMVVVVAWLRVHGALPCGHVHDNPDHNLAFPFDAIG